MLSDTFSQDADRLARFEREAKSLASLNHPNIAAIHSVHEAETSMGTVRFLAMELVPGEDPFWSRTGSRFRSGDLRIEY